MSVRVLITRVSEWAAGGSPPCFPDRIHRLSSPTPILKAGGTIDYGGSASVRILVVWGSDLAIYGLARTLTRLIFRMMQRILPPVSSRNGNMVLEPVHTPLDPEVAECGSMPRHLAMNRRPCLLSTEAKISTGLLQLDTLSVRYCDRSRARPRDGS